MPRPRSFDETAVLDAAAELFRATGFAETTTADLCSATGLQRSSLYNAFESKDGVFVAALERYVAATKEVQAAALSTPDLSGADRLCALLDAVLEEERVSADRGHAAGCLVVSTLMLPDVRERVPAVARVLERDLERRVGMLTMAVRAGQADGSLSDDVPAGEAALLVVTLISGLRVSAQAGVDLGTLRRLAETGLSALTR